MSEQLSLTARMRGARRSGRAIEIVDYPHDLWDGRSRVVNFGRVASRLDPVLRSGGRALTRQEGKSYEKESDESSAEKRAAFDA